MHNALVVWSCVWCGAAFDINSSILIKNVFYILYISCDDDDDEVGW